MRFAPRAALPVLTLLVSGALVTLALPAAAAPAPSGAGVRHRTASPRLAEEARHRVPNPLLKEQLSEEEEGEGEDDPALSALCQDFVGKPNPYRDPRPNVDQIVGDTTVTTGSQAGCSSAQNETSIAVNPYNPRNIVAGSNDYRVFVEREGRNDSTGWAYTSFDGGRTWKNVQLPGLTIATGATGALRAMDSAGDPVLAFGPGNTVYYANIAFSRFEPAPGGTEAPSAITLNVSHDGGLHWSAPTIVQIDGASAAGEAVPTTFFNDKVWMAADKVSGRVYVTWTRFADTPEGDYLESPIVVASSTDFGAPSRRTGGSTRRWTRSRPA